MGPDDRGGYATARAVALSILVSLKQQLGDLDRIKRVVRLFGMVNAAPGFDRMPQVIDGASDFSTSCSVRKTVSMHARRSASPNCRTGFRSKSMANSSFTPDRIRRVASCLITFAASASPIRASGGQTARSRR
jgi:hypothetical protein